MLKCENCIYTCNLGGIQSRFFVWRLRIPIHDVWIVWSLWYVDSTPSLAHSDVSYTTGSYPCLYCLIPKKNMAMPLSGRGHAPPRSLHSIHTHHQKDLASGGVRKTAQQFYNCICEPIFDIPTEQVLSHDMHAIVFTLY